MPDLNYGDVVEVDGSKGERYQLKRIGAVYSCSCPSWKHSKEPERRRTCKHLKAYRGELAEKARTKSLVTSPLFRGEALEEIFRADLLDEAEVLLAKGEIKKASDLVECAHQAKKRGEAISLVATSEQEKWIEAHVVRCWKLRSDVLAAHAEKDPAMEPLAQKTRKSAEKLEDFIKKQSAGPSGKPNLRIVRPDDKQ